MSKSIWEEKETYILKLFFEKETAIDIIRALGLQPNTTSYRKLKQFSEQHSIAIPRLSQSEISLTRVRNSLIKKSPINEEIFKEKSPYNRKLVKKRALAAKYLEYKCYGSICSSSQISLENWDGIVLQLEHKNGIGDDNRKENLELLCPNCHSMTATFTSKNKNKYKNGSHGTCSECNRPSKDKKCYFCDNTKLKLSSQSLEQILREVSLYGDIKTAEKYSVSLSTLKNVLKERINNLDIVLNTIQPKSNAVYPPAIDLAEEVRNGSYTSIAKKYGVSDNAIRKYLTKHLGKENLPRKKKM